MDRIDICDEASKLTDDMVNHYNSLELARAAHADVKKKTEASAFHSINWHDFTNNPIDGAAVLEQLTVRIKDEETALETANKGLEEVLGRMNWHEQTLWWAHCQRLFSSIEPLLPHEPVASGPDIEMAMKEIVARQNEEDERCKQQEDKDDITDETEDEITKEAEDIMGKEANENEKDNKEKKNEDQKQEEEEEKEEDEEDEEEEEEEKEEKKNSAQPAIELAAVKKE